MAEKDYALVVKDLYKSFRLPHEQHLSLKNKLVGMLKGQRGYETQHVLKDISFEIEKGEFFGIVGRNGSGKSTLLKLIAGVYTPDKGEVRLNGSLTPFIELGVGFNPELTGRENVFLNGALMGFSRSEMQAMYDEIVEFAELEKFMDQKLKNYSSGMQVRLAFSIAIRAESDILLLDEVLAVGDASFQQKCFDYFADLKKGHKTVILVTHSMPMVERFCNRALLLENGVIVECGKSSKIASRYEDMFLEDQNKKSDKVSAPGEPAEERQEPSRITAKLGIMQDGKKVKAVRAGQPFVLDIEVVSKLNVEEANIGINIRDDQDRVVFSTDALRAAGQFGFEAGKPKRIIFEIENYYTNGKYSIDLHVVNEGGGSGKVLFRERKISNFLVIGVVAHQHSLFHPPYKVKIT